MKDQSRGISPAALSGRLSEPAGSLDDAAPLRVAVVGAGVAGLACARLLRDHACEVVVFDRGRGPGGRLSTRRVEGEGDAEMSFDHGAPFFTVTDAEFDRHVRSWIADGVCSQWNARSAAWRVGVLRPTGREHPLIVGVPAMSAVCGHLARDLDVRTGTAITELARGGDGWRPAGTDDRFDAVVVAAPAPQAARLVAAHSASIAGALAGVQTRPTWVVMLALDAPLDGLPDVVDVEDDASISLIVRDDAKPGRSAREGRSRWVIHARHDWSAARYDAPRDEVGAELTGEALRVMSGLADATIADIRVVHAAAHRWGLAQTAAPIAETCLFDQEARLAVCGDGCGGGGVEAAFLGGHAAARRVLSLRGHAWARADPGGTPAAR